MQYYSFRRRRHAKSNSFLFIERNALKLATVKPLESGHAGYWENLCRPDYGNSPILDFSVVLCQNHHFPYIFSSYYVILLFRMLVK